MNQLERHTHDYIGDIDLGIQKKSSNFKSGHFLLLTVHIASCMWMVMSATHCGWSWVLHTVDGHGCYTLWMPMSATHCGWSWVLHTVDGHGCYTLWMVMGATHCSLASPAPFPIRVASPFSYSPPTGSGKRVWCQTPLFLLQMSTGSWDTCRKLIALKFNREA